MLAHSLRRSIALTSPGHTQPLSPSLSLSLSAPLGLRLLPALSLPLTEHARSIITRSRGSYSSSSYSQSQSQPLSPPMSLSQLESAANSQPWHSPYQLNYLRALATVDPMAVLRRIDSGQFTRTPEIMIEYEKAKQRLDAQSLYASGNAPGHYAYTSQPSLIGGQTGYQNYNMQPPYTAQPSQSSSLSPPLSPSQSLGSATQPISVQIVRSPTDADPPRSFVFRFFSSLFRLAIPLAIIGGILYVTSTAAGGGGGLMGGRGQIKEFKHDGDVPKVQFGDVKGCDEAKSELEEIVAYLKNPQHFEKLGGKMVKGVLLTGPPGTGKTLLAKAIAGEAHVPFFSCSGSDFEEMFVGVGARRIRDLFAAARKKSPCIIFIDEIDAVGSKRSGRDVQAARLSLNQLLVEMDGFNHSTGVIVIGATNLPSLLDPALTRPGRFDRHVTVPVPDVKGRKQILDLYSKNIPMSNDVNLDILARGTSGCTGAQLYNLINSAALRASSKGLPHVNMFELEYAKDKILMGAERSSLMTDEEKKLTAYHEGGHTLVAYFTKHSIPLYKATILPRGQSLGTTHFLPESDIYSQSKAQLIARLDVAMGGRVAEEIIFGAENVTTGASSDLESATKIARSMVMQYGMTDNAKLGLMSVNEDEMDSVSPTRKSIIDEEITRVLNDSHQRAKEILTANTELLHKLARALLKYETLDAKQIKQLCEGRASEVLGAASDKTTVSVTSEKEPSGGSELGGKIGTIVGGFPHPSPHPLPSQ